MVGKKLTERIREEKDVARQLRLADHGKDLTALEQMVRSYLEHESPGWSLAVAKFLSPESVEQLRRYTTRHLCDEFLRVLRAGDWKAIRRLAASGPELLSDTGYPIRAGILVWKLADDVEGREPAFDWQIAKVLRYNGNKQVFAKLLKELRCPYKVEHGGAGHKRPD